MGLLAQKAHFDLIYATEGRWGRGQPVRLAGGDYRTRSRGSKSPAQSAQCCCSIGRRRIISGSARIAATAAIDQHFVQDILALGELRFRNVTAQRRIISVPEFGL